MSLSSISLLAPDPDKLWEDKGAKSISFFCRVRPVRIDSTVVAELKEIARRNDNRNVRVCLHSGPDADHHDMVILEHAGRFYPPHSHDGKGECFHIIEGKLGVVVFTAQGEVAEAVVLCPGDIYRLAEGSIHAVMPVTEQVVYHEDKPGPFTGPGDSIIPSWAPRDADAQEAFGRRLRATLPV